MDIFKNLPYHSLLRMSFLPVFRWETQVFQREEKSFVNGNPSLSLRLFCYGLGSGQKAEKESFVFKSLSEEIPSLSGPGIMIIPRKEHTEKCSPRKLSKNSWRRSQKETEEYIKYYWEKLLLQNRSNLNLTPHTTVFHQFPYTLIFGRWLFLEIELALKIRSFKDQLIKFDVFLYL